MTIGLDASYSLDREPSGVGVYSREILFGLARQYPEDRFHFFYRPHRLRASLRDALPSNSGRGLIFDRALLPAASLFHGLNQRMPQAKVKAAVSTFHDLFVLTAEYSTPEFRARFAQQAREAAARSDLIIAVSEFTADQVHDLLGVERSRLRVVHHGIHVTQTEPVSREPVILHTGVIQIRKNIAALIDAFEKTDVTWRLVLAGSRDGYGAHAIIDRIAKSPARARIDVTGYISRVQLEDWYRRASIFAFPSLDEGFGIPVLEAMAHGLPVIASTRGALPEVCGDAALLIDPKKPESLGAALVQLTGNESLRQELVTKGKARAALFSWERAVKSTRDVYRELGY